MILRTLLLAVGLSAVVACEDGTAAQARHDARNALADVGDEIAEAAEEGRDELVAALERGRDRMDAAVVDLRDRLEQGADVATAEGEEFLEELEHARTQLELRLRELNDSGEEAYEAARDKVVSAWNELNDRFDDAYDALVGA